MVVRVSAGPIICPLPAFQGSFLCLFSSRKFLCLQASLSDFNPKVLLKLVSVKCNNYWNILSMPGKQLTGDPSGRSGCRGVMATMLEKSELEKSLSQRLCPSHVSVNFGVPSWRMKHRGPKGKQFALFVLRLSEDRCAVNIRAPGAGAGSALQYKSVPVEKPYSAERNCSTCTIMPHRHLTAARFLCEMN